MIKTVSKGSRMELNSPTALPNASAFLWNKKMMIHMNCRGYAVAQFMQPEPAKYAHAPNLEAKTFMQPEQPYFAHHPGRFFYIKDEKTGELFSAPHEPVRAKIDSYIFSPGQSDIKWKLEHKGLQIELTLTLPKDEVIEIWSLKIKNSSKTNRKLSLYPYFPIGYMSWMNQSGYYNETLQGVICSSVTPYQKYHEYEKVKTLKDKTFFLADIAPFSWEVNQTNFEGEGGLQHPDGVKVEALSKGDARYETPAAILQYREELSSGAEKRYNFLFGPARTEEEISATKKRYFGTEGGLATAYTAYKNYVAEGADFLKIHTPDAELDNFVNTWLPRQMYYHGETNRLSTDPQTRNYLQDNMGMAYIKPKVARQAFITALSQQEESGAMPDGILIHPEAELKYINQVPHTDHCVWLPVCLKAYLDETNDYALLDEIVPFMKKNKTATVAEHLSMAVQWLYDNRDERGLNFIDQGDWCDPMNGVGPKGKGVSGWLSMATTYALRTWAGICASMGDMAKAKDFKAKALEVSNAVNEHLWDGNWFARGITDDNVKFGVSKDAEGTIFLNAQSWAILSGCAHGAKEERLVCAVEDHLETPYGVEMFAPPFSEMREDVGRVTQKHPGSAENGSVYNHAAAFYIYSLFLAEYKEKGFELLRKMIPGPDENDIVQRGQLPVFIPNYYRGAYRQYPRTAGRSSQLFNTGTVPWVYRSLIDGLFGLQGSPEGLLIKPQLPRAWKNASVVRKFRRATFHVTYEQGVDLKEKVITVNGQTLEGDCIADISPKEYKVKVLIPLRK